MKKYVVLLRGVNVGGNHRVSKAEFQKVLENLGFRDVATYINSGNAVFTSDGEPQVSDIQTALETYFGFGIPTLLLSGEKIKAIAAAIPPGPWKPRSSCSPARNPPIRRGVRVACGARGLVAELIDPTSRDIMNLT